MIVEGAYYMGQCNAFGRCRTEFGVPRKGRYINLYRINGTTFSQRDLTRLTCLDMVLTGVMTDV